MVLHRLPVVRQSWLDLSPLVASSRLRKSGPCDLVEEQATVRKLTPRKSVTDVNDKATDMVMNARGVDT